jgi:hypothetical protein
LLRVHGNRLQTLLPGRILRMCKMGLKTMRSKPQDKIE